MKCDGRSVGGSIRIAATFAGRFLGLMFRRRLPEGSGLLLMPCTGIHMCFMRMPLDIVYLDGFFRVLAVERGLRPWRLGRRVPGTRLVLELPAGTLARCGVTPGKALTVMAPDTQAQFTAEEREMHGYERAGGCCQP